MKGCDQHARNLYLSPIISMAEQDMNTQKGANMGNSMDTDRQSEMGREGQSQGGSESGGNLKNDPGRASEAGRKGGER